MLGETQAKKSRPNMKIGTHNGTFHCDEVLAVWMLKQTAQFEDADIVRSRTPEVLDTCDIVVDVGAVFDHSARRYDHHQREFKETFNSLDSSKRWTTKLSSAGLVFVHYGKEVIRVVMEKISKEKGDGSTVSDRQVEVIADKVYENLIEEVDAVDNGIAAFDGDPRYRVTTTLSSRVGYLNPRWNEETSDAIAMERFKKAMELVRAEFVDRVTYYQLAWLPVHSKVKDVVKKRYDVHESGEIITFDQTSIPWKEHLMDIEEELKVSSTIKYVLYEDMTNKRWRVQCVPIRADSFENRLSLPADWCGLRDEALSERTGIPDCVFVHVNGFIGGNQTYAGVLEMAVKSLKLAKDV